MTDFKIFIPPLDAAKPNPETIFRFKGIRFTLLTPRMLRVEISPADKFEDDPSQIFWYRNQPLPVASIIDSEKNLHIETDFFTLSYQKTPSIFKRKNPRFNIKYSGQNIHLDSPNPLIFPGTARSLDKTNGSINLQPGILSRSGWVILDDTDSLVIDQDGWLRPRPAQKGYRDLYLLISGKDYKSALHDFQLIAGGPPLLPRAFLGNWWSRYWEYSEEDIKKLIQRFSQEEIPLSVFILDMDWHITKTGNKCSGWTGFSWNRDLFPDPQELIQWIHNHKLMISLNLHPAEGIYPHEDGYFSAAEKMGLDPEKLLSIPFNIADPKFTKVYFEQMLHPLENQGVDFWWIDWQQGSQSELKNLDPLWWLNHLHFYDLGRVETKRPIVLSRWGGQGNHRYPIGFSGDTIVTWKSLDFQPFFTATAANSAYGYWSHDIGGHMAGTEDGELYTRWVQFGVLSPIFRLHCTKSESINRAPWSFNQEILRITREAMQFRHALVPYLYTLAKKNEDEGIPMITPLYYHWPEEEDAYELKNQYMIGDQLLAAPITSPLDKELKLSQKVIWIPKGTWFNFFTGKRFIGPQRIMQYYALDEIPLFAKSGAILPLQHEKDINGCQNPSKIDLIVFPGNGSFELYEDDGTTQEYKKHGGAITKFICSLQDTYLSVQIDPAIGQLRCIPWQRTYQVIIRGVDTPTNPYVKVDGESISVNIQSDPDRRSIIIEPIKLTRYQLLSMEITL